MSPQPLSVNPSLADIKLVSDFIVRMVYCDQDAASPLRLQKLLYYVEAWYLANFNKPLFAESPQAWAHGPVYPSVWRRYQRLQWNIIRPQLEPVDLDEDLGDFICNVYDAYSLYSAKKLEELTHNEAPWQKTRAGLSPAARCHKPMDKLLIRDYYRQRLEAKEIQTT